MSENKCPNWPFAGSYPDFCDSCIHQKTCYVLRDKRDRDVLEQIYSDLGEMK